MSWGGLLDSRPKYVTRSLWLSGDEPCTFLRAHVTGKLSNLGAKYLQKYTGLFLNDAGLRSHVSQWEQ